VVAGRARWPRPAIAVAATAVLAACGSGGASPLVHRGDVVDVPMGSLTARDVAATQTAFGLDLVHALCEQSPGENLLISPTSAAEALGLVHPAAGGETAEAFRTLLHLPQWSPDLVAAMHSHTLALDGLRYDGDLDDGDAPDSLQMSNRLWTAPTLEPDEEYLDDLATAFDADVRALDFADPEGATERINTTVADDTRGVIEELFAEPLPAETVVVLTNALHLTARWTTPFSGTQPAPFAAPSGNVTVDMMDGGHGSARAVDGWHAVELPYLDGTLVAIAVLPPEDADPCAVDAATLAALGSAAETPVGVRLPRMTIQQGHQLLEPLTELGLPVAGDYPAFGGGDLTISHVVQEVFLRVDEEGTEAAAATGVGLAGSAPLDDVVTFDRPFLFLLADTATRSPLFVTVVHDPSA
jgi:serpin B